MPKKERRTKRSTNTTEALFLQLEACRKAAKLEGMVVSDHDGVCLATSGDETSCEEIAANLPIVARKVAKFDGVLYSADRWLEVRMKRFGAGADRLLVCAIGGKHQDREAQVQRSVAGLQRILASAAA